VYAVAALSASVVVFEHVHAEESLELASEGADIARSAGFAATPRGEVAVPTVTWEGILDVADEIGARGIAVGSHGPTGLPEFVAGSVSHEVAKHSSRPVLVVPPETRRR